MDIVETTEEGTAWYVCAKCGMACDSKNLTILTPDDEELEQEVS